MRTTRAPFDLLQNKNGPTNPAARYGPLLARTRTVHRPVDPVAFDCVKVIIVRDGSALLFSEFGQQIVTVRDVVVLGANVLCGSEPEGHITTTTIYLDTDFVIDQGFWQHAWLFRDRLDAQRFTEAIYSEPSQVLRLGRGPYRLVDAVVRRVGWAQHRWWIRSSFSSHASALVFDR